MPFRNKMQRLLKHSVTNFSRAKTNPLNPIVIKRITYYFLITPITSVATYESCSR